MSGGLWSEESLGKEGTGKHHEHGSHLKQTMSKTLELNMKNKGEKSFSGKVCSFPSFWYFLGESKIMLFCFLRERLASNFLITRLHRTGCTGVGSAGSGAQLCHCPAVQPGKAIKGKQNALPGLCLLIYKRGAVLMILLS